MDSKKPGIAASSNIQYVVAVLIMSAFGVAAVVSITVLRPSQDNTVLIASVFGFLLPTTMALLAFLKTQETHLMVNSRLEDFIKEAKAASRAEGVTEGMHVAEGRSDVIAGRVETARDKTS